MAYNYVGYTLVSLSSSSAIANNNNANEETKTLIERDFLCNLEEMKYYDESGIDINLSLGPPLNNVKKCFTCGQTETPLWRTGPNGPKSLCNACGIRYRKQLKRLNTSLSLAPPNAYLAKK